MADRVEPFAMLLLRMYEQIDRNRRKSLGSAGLMRWKAVIATLKLLQRLMVVILGVSVYGPLGDPGMQPRFGTPAANLLDW